MRANDLLMVVVYFVEGDGIVIEGNWKSMDESTGDSLFRRRGKTYDPVGTK